MNDEQIESLANHLRERIEEDFHEDLHAVLDKGEFENLIKEWRARTEEKNILVSNVTYAALEEKAKARGLSVDQFVAEVVLNQSRR